MSTSVVRKKWGMGPSDVAKRLAMVLRICVKGTSSYGAPLGAGCGMRDAGCDSTTAGAAAGTDARGAAPSRSRASRSEEHTSELQSRFDLVCRLLLEKKKKTI